MATTEAGAQSGGSAGNMAHALCGAAAGIFSKMILQPFDLVRTRFQLQDSACAKTPKYTSIRHAFASIIKQEGPTGLYIGAAPNLLGSGLAWSVYFFTYSHAKAYLRQRSHAAQLKQHQLLLASSLCSSFVLLLTNPIWFVKTRMQLQYRHLADGGAYQYRSAVDAFRRIASEEGPLTFYRGLGPALALTSTGALQMYFYENLRRAALLGTGAGDSRLPVAATLAMGALSKSAAAAATYPVLMVKARLYQRAAEGAGARQRYRGVRDVVASVLREEGARGFYKGLVPHLAKTAPGAAITFSTYEYLIRLVDVRW